jgi:hypothetical protein
LNNLKQLNWLLYNTYPCGIYECDKSPVGMKYPRTWNEYEPYADAPRLVFDINIKSFFPGLTVGLILGF